MTITTLRDSPHLYAATINLIEKSFKYDSVNSFSIDFAPLMTLENHHNCYLFTDAEGDVVAHIGALEKKILGQTVCLLGGIAVDEAKRGEGIFQTLMIEVLSEKKADVSMFLLWSDKESLYKKFGFYLCGQQFQHHQKQIADSNFVKSKYHTLPPSEKQQIKQLYVNSFSKLNETIARDDKDWGIIEKITSADLYLKKEAGHVLSYFFKNKGQDLQNIIYEYGTNLEFKSEIKEITSFGNIWSTTPFAEEDEAQYQYMMCPGDTRLFGDFIQKYTSGQIKIEDVSSVKQEIYFHFNNELLGLETEEFLKGIFGPAPFEELGELKPIFISGLDSI